MELIITKLTALALIGTTGVHAHKLRGTAETVIDRIGISSSSTVDGKEFGTFNRELRNISPTVSFRLVEPATDHAVFRCLDLSWAGTAWRQKDPSSCSSFEMDAVTLEKALETNQITGLI
eukprot:804143_1